MKTLIALILALAASSTIAAVACGLPPLPPLGCQMMCVCSGGNCSWVAVCK